MSNEQARFDKAIKAQCEAVQKKRVEWSSLVDTLRKIQLLFTQNMDAKITPDVRTKLAQLLSSSLIPGFSRQDAHEDALDVYDKILERQIRIYKGSHGEDEALVFNEDLGLFYSGLFGFYQHASNKMKKEKLLEIIKNRVLKLQNELVVCLPGFITCMMHALNEQSSENLDLVKTSEEILDQTEKIVGTSCFYGEIWKTMLRSQKCCLKAIGYLVKRIPKSPSEVTRKLVANPQHISFSKRLLVRKGRINVLEMSEEQREKEIMHLKILEKYSQDRKEEAMEAYKYFYFPNKDELVHQALLVGLSKDRSNLVNRATLDLLISHMPIRRLESRMNSKETKIAIMESALRTLNIGDYACLTKVLQWFDGEEDPEMEPISESKDQQMVELDEQETDVINITTAAFKKILQATKDRFSEWKINCEIESDPELWRYMCSPLIILSEFMKSLVSEEEDPEKPYNIGDEIIKMISIELIGYIHFLNQERAGLKNFSQIHDIVANLFTTLKNQRHLVWEALKEGVDQEENNNDTIHLIEFCLKQRGFLIDDQDRVFEEIEVRKCVDLLGKIVEMLDTERNQQKEILKKYQDLIKMLLKFFKDNDRKILSDSQQELGQIVNKFNTYYIEQYTDKARVKEIDPSDKLSLENFKMSSYILIEIQRHSSQKEEDSRQSQKEKQQIPYWLSYLIKRSCEKNLELSVLLIFQDAVIQIFEQASKTEREVELDMKEIVADQNNENLPLKVKRTYTRFSTVIEEHEPTKEKTTIYIDLKKMIKSQKYRMKVPCTEQIIRTLWQTLEKKQNQQAIVDLCMRFDLELPAEFSKIICEDFPAQKKGHQNMQEEIESSDFIQNAEVANKKKRTQYFIGAVEKFRIFWKLTEKYADSYTPFSRTVNQDKCRNFDALHRMLDILEKSDPTLRLCCRQWLSESRSNFDRILDPLLIEFMRNTKVYATFSGQLIFYGDNSTMQKQVISNFKKLRNIIMNLNTQDKFLRYISQHPVQSEKLKPIFQTMPMKKNFQPSQNGDQKFTVKLCVDKYIQIITCITLQFIMAQSVDQDTEEGELSRRSEKINATACEFMELLLKSLQKKQPELLTEIMHLIIKPLIQTLQQAIINKNNTLQVHMLNLFRVLFEGDFFYSKELTIGYRKHAEKLFMEDLFIKECIIKGMKNEVAFVRNAFIGFSEMIVVKMHQIIGPLAIRNKENIEKLSSHIGALVGKYTELMGYVRLSNENQKDISTEMVIDQEIDAISVVNSLKHILFYCLGVEKQEFITTEEKALHQEFKKQKELRQKSTIVHNQIYKDMKQILIACMNCWDTRDVIPLNDFYFTRSGMFAKSVRESAPEKLGMTDLQKEIVYMLKTVANASVDLDYPEKTHFESIKNVVGSALDIWINKEELTQREGRKQNLTNAAETLVEILLEIELRPEQIVKATENFIKKLEKEMPQLVRSHSKQTYTLTKTDKKEGTFQSLMCQFIFTILHGNVHETFNDTQRRDLFENARKFFGTFIHTKHPNTICWLLEILRLLTQAEFLGDKTNTLGKDIIKSMKNTLEHLLKSAVLFLDTSEKQDTCQNKFGVSFSINYGIHQMCFPPTVYEMIKRFEFVRIKHEYNQLRKPKTTNHDDSDSDMSSPFKMEEDYYQITDMQRSPVEAKQESISVRNKDFHFTEAELEQKEELQMPNKDSIFKHMDIVRSGQKQLLSCQQSSNLDKEQEETHEEKTKDFEDETMGILLNGLRKHIEDDTSSFIDSVKQMHYFQFFVVLTIRANLITQINQLTAVIKTGQKDPLLGMVITTLLKELKSMIKNSDLREEFSWKQKILIEMYTQVLADLFSAGNELYHYKNEIMDIYREDNFFLQSKCTLGKWQVVIHKLTIQIGRKEDQGLGPIVAKNMFEELLKEYDLAKSLVDNQSQKINTFKRLAFVVFSDSGDMQKMSPNNYVLLRQMMTRIFSDLEKSIELTQQMFMLMRILLLRLDPEQLQKEMALLWPYILTEFDILFDSQYLIGNSKSVQKERMQLVTAGLNLVRLMSKLNIEDFCMNKWMFLFDGYGLKEEKDDMAFFSMGSLEPDSPVKKNLGKDYFQVEYESNMVCQPYIVKYMCNFGDSLQNHYELYDADVQPKEANEDFCRENAAMTLKRRSSIVLQAWPKKEAKMTPKDEIKRLAQNVALGAEKIQDELSKQNMKAPEIDRKKEEERIRKDFLDYKRHTTTR